MNQQHTFDRVTAFAHKQNSKSIAVNQRSCFYREDHTELDVDIHKGRMCFVGAFIPDNVYAVTMESKDAETLFTSAPSLFNDHFTIDDLNDDQAVEFWMDMQQIHDERDVDEWKSAFMSYASDKGLDYVAPR